MNVLSHGGIMGADFSCFLLEDLGTEVGGTCSANSYQ